MPFGSEIEHYKFTSAITTNSQQTIKNWLGLTGLFAPVVWNQMLFAPRPVCQDSFQILQQFKAMSNFKICKQELCMKMLFDWQWSYPICYLQFNVHKAEKFFSGSGPGCFLTCRPISLSGYNFPFKELGHLLLQNIWRNNSFNLNSCVFDTSNTHADTYSQTLKHKDSSHPRAIDQHTGSYFSLCKH